MSPEKLRQVLDAHQKWLRSDRSEGIRADLRRADLSGADLEGVDLRDASLRKANLKGARLFGANLERANLQKADLQGAVLTDASLCGAELRKATLQHADLTNVDLQEANLTGADLTGADMSRIRGLEKAKLNNINMTDVAGLLGYEFAGADITGAKLPSDIARFDGLNYVETASRQARIVFLAMVGGCLYTWLTIWTTKDVDLIVSTAMTALPIIQTKVPIAGFFWAAPLILLGFYFYFHLALQGLWEALARLPAVFPDGAAIDQKCYPWLLMSLARAHIPMLERNKPPLWRMRVGLALLAAWGLVPLTLFLLWLRYLPRHDSIGVVLLIASLLLALWLGILFYRLMRAALKLTAVHYRGRFHVASVATVFLVAVVTTAVSYAAIGSGRQFEFLGYGFYAELTKDKLGEAQIEGIDLRFAQALNAQLAGADLEGTNLEGANLQSAVLTNANLKSAILTGANLKRAELDGANLKWADLSNANLSHAILRKANLKGANLKGANLSGADFKEAELKGAILEDSNLGDADLTAAKLSGSDLRSANLAGAKLKDAVFEEEVSWWKYPKDSAPSGADRSAVNMLGVDLKGADVTDVDLSNVRSLTVQQVQHACGDRTTKLPSSFNRPLEWAEC